jgi:pilus assembly protein CpaC
MRHLLRGLTKHLIEIVVALTLLGAPLRGFAASVGTPLSMESGTGKVVSLDGQATNVFVADPKVAEVRPASPSTLFVFGVGAGQTSVAAMDSNGKLISQFQVTVLPSHFNAGQAQATIAHMIPGSNVSVQPSPTGLMLAGHVENAGEVAQVAAIARGYLGTNQTLDNEVTTQSSIQVTLQVRVAEMSRQVVRNLGVNWQALGTIGSIGPVLPALTLNANANPIQCPAPLPPICSGGNFNGVIDALAQDNLAHILAEPNLTVMSGQSASFLVGGEFPIPVAQQNNSISVAFKNFGVSLTFVPTVFSDGRINVHVSPEVSSTSNQNSVQVAAGTSTFVIPSLVVQRAETTVELGSGQTFAIAGLLQDTVTHDTNGLPILGDVPILGPLFRSDAFNRQQTELVILVTPFVVRPVNNATAMHTPDENYTPPGELDRLLLLHQTGRPGATTPVNVPGAAGFVVQ